MLIDSRISEYTLLTFLHLHENRPGSEETLESKMLAAALGSFDQFLTMFGKCPFRGWHRRKSDMSIRLSKVSWHYLCEVHFEFSTLISVNWTGILDGIPHGKSVLVLKSLQYFWVSEISLEAHARLTFPISAIPAPNIHPALTHFSYGINSKIISDDHTPRRDETIRQAVEHERGGRWVTNKGRSEI